MTTTTTTRETRARKGKELRLFWSVCLTMATTLMMMMLFVFFFSLLFSSSSFAAAFLPPGWDQTTFFLPCVVVRVLMCYKKRTTPSTTTTTLSTQTATITGGVRLKSHVLWCLVLKKFEAREGVEECFVRDCKNLTKKRRKRQHREKKSFPHWLMRQKLLSFSPCFCSCVSYYTNSIL